MKKFSNSISKANKCLVATATCLMATFFMAQSANAQVQGVFDGKVEGKDYDMLNLNKNNSSSDSGIRLTNNNRSYYLWSRNADKIFRISWGGSYAVKGIEADLMELNSSGNMLIKGTLGNLSGNTLTISDNLNVAGNLSVSGTIKDGNSDVHIDDGLIVSGAIKDNNSDVHINDGLIVTGNISDNNSAVTINDDLVVTGRISDNNSDVHINDGLIVTGAISDNNSNVHINDGLIVSGYITDNNSDVHINDGLIVTGNISDNNSAVTINDDLVVVGHISDSNGDVIINDALSVVGATTLKNNVTVQGSIVANEVTLNVGSFPDYVFEDHYELMPLAKVAQHINKHKRLPKMPSEQEVLENGMNTAQINVLLVEKVEELTLHTIAQEKKIEQMEKALAKLLKQLND